ncbi:hypothetical protein LEP1GSC021_3392 [Leptospira noguchii str. 1993005606]|nr:hypothetical protein [Leptospira noguchii]EPE81904.1 hypothetical protein LEP1GSC021_1170 [Leptospira noguchii str. 1993005606]EPE82024.1 hypothetical protein LEP1GSC021_4135 [Leptospira noguchii str. 1993005606]EPE84231.1 hypothetical protein LEP1GSC021_3631 [Leptospira noguchii str. 1993005606]EPE84543.1 hypothetical protein LEP1GSC021_1264 [Leptospira noguchii str. 1993005606]EPE84720.1 hypothetical protein LEP1GSC021_3392 [Leptospira noguchii str. 1993005606]
MTNRVNSAKRFPELSVSLPMGRSTGRVLRSNLQSRSASTRN